MFRTELPDRSVSLYERNLSISERIYSEYFEKIKL